MGCSAITLGLSVPSNVAIVFVDIAIKFEVVFNVEKMISRKITIHLLFA